MAGSAQNQTRASVLKAFLVAIANLIEMNVKKINPAIRFVIIPLVVLPASAGRILHCCQMDNHAAKKVLCEIKSAKK